MGNYIKQVLSFIGHRTFPSKRYNFEKIFGHTDVKLILNKALLSERPVHVLLTGKPGSAKTMFLTEIMHCVKDSYFTIGTNTTKAGLINQLFESRPKFLLIDELEKMKLIPKN